LPRRLRTRANSAATKRPLSATRTSSATKATAVTSGGPAQADPAAGFGAAAG
jgi:hypothetical protein